MQIDHDSRAALDELVWLANSGERGERGDRGTANDPLGTPAALQAFLDERRITGARTGDEAELQAVRRMRARLRRVFELAGTGEGTAVVEALNTLIGETGARPRLVEHDGLPLHLHFTAPDAPLDQRLAAEMAIALAIVVRDGGVERIRTCATPRCGRVLVDLSKNRSRRYCDAQCGNRGHVAAYRRRQAGAC